MGEPVVLQQVPGLASQLASGVANFFASQRKAKLAQAAVNYQHGRDKVADQHSDRDFGIKQSELDIEKNQDKRAATAATDTHNAAGANLLSVQLGNKSKALQLEIDKETRKYTVLKARADAEYARGQVVDQGTQISLHRSQARVAQLQAAHEPIVERLADLQSQASTNSSNASAESSRASAAASGAETSRINALLPGEVANQNITNTNLQYQDNPLGALDPKEQAFVADLVSHASKLTPAQMALRVQAGLKRPVARSAAIRYLNSNTAADYNPAATGYVKPPRTNPNAITAGERDAKTITSTLEKNAQFSGLPANAQANFLGAFAHGHTYGDAVSAYKHVVADPNFAQSFGVSVPEAQSVLDALGVSAQ